MHITGGVDKWDAWVNIENYDPSPGQRGWYRSMRGPLGHGHYNLDEAERWRRKTVREIRRLMRKLKLPEGTNFHQVIRAYQGLPLTCEPEQGPSREAEDYRLIAEFEWEARRRTGWAFPRRCKSFCTTISATRGSRIIPEQGVVQHAA